jgi:ubiquinone/menaquinone biosynthesis C-methylase UbiE
MIAFDDAAAGAVVLRGSRAAHDCDRPDIETASEGYAARFASPAGQWLLARQAAALSTLLDCIGPAPLKTLEIGGGHAQIAPTLLSRGHSVVLHGSAPQCFDRVEPLRGESNALRPVAAGMWELPFRDRAFDLTVAVRLLAHVTRWRELFAEIARVSARYVIVEFPRAGWVRLPQAANDAVFGLKRLMEGNTRPYFSYRQRDLVGELGRLGFGLVDCTAQFVLPMALHRMAHLPKASEHVEDLLRAIGLGDTLRSPALVLVERLK